MMKTFFSTREIKRGFSLLEILVTLMLLSLVVGISLTVGGEDPDHILKAAQHIERAVRFGQDEGTLRNAVVRLHFQLDSDPQKFQVEYGPDGHFVIPTKVLQQETEGLLKEEQEEISQAQEDLQRDFNAIPELKGQGQKIHEGITIVAVGSALYKKLITKGEASIFLYPTGEKDESVIYFASGRELMSVEIPAFGQEVSIQRHPLEGPLQEKVQKAKELFENWIADSPS